MPESPEVNPYKKRPFFRRILYRLFGNYGMVNTLPQSQADAQRLMRLVENQVQDGNMSVEGLQYLQMVHLHAIGDGLDRLLRAQEKTNTLLNEIASQNEVIIGLMEGQDPEEADPARQQRRLEPADPVEPADSAAQQPEKPATPSANPTPDGDSPEELDLDTAEVERP